MLVIAPTTKFGIPMEHRIKIKLIGQTDAIVHVNRHLHFLLLQLILFFIFYQRGTWPDHRTFFNTNILEVYILKIIQTSCFDG
jgi:hypothetical protein